jgi:hypothetical protein
MEAIGSLAALRFIALVGVEAWTPSQAAQPDTLKTVGPLAADICEGGTQRQ